jgi:hypothetical protein
MKHKVTLLRGKAIERGDFERSWKRTREELAIRKRERGNIKSADAKVEF